MTQPTTTSRRELLASGLALGGIMATSEAFAAAASSAVRSFELDIDVTAVAEVGEPAHTRVTVTLPRPSDLPATPIVCFGLPGGGYSRGYYTFDMPGSKGGGQAGWHAGRGWIFVSMDHLGVGASSLPDRNKLVYKNVTAANHTAAQEILKRLADGTLSQGFPAVKKYVTIGIGQSMGGCLTIVQQARHNSYDGVAALGYSAIDTSPGAQARAMRGRAPYVPRDAAPGGAGPVASSSVIVNSALLRMPAPPSSGNPAAGMGAVFHYDDVPADIVKQDMEAFPTRNGKIPVWASATVPGLAAWVTTPGAIAPEAAAIVVPVLAAFGERDVLEDPRMEPKAYRRSVDTSMFICPRMGHMHNFASTREAFWTRIETWANHVVALKALFPDKWPAQMFSDSY